MSLRLSIHDAATNCARDGTVAVVTLRSGVQFTGKLEKPSDAGVDYDPEKWKALR